MGINWDRLKRFHIHTERTPKILMTGLILIVDIRPTIIYSITQFRERIRLQLQRMVTTQSDLVPVPREVSRYLLISPSQIMTKVTYMFFPDTPEYFREITWKIRNVVNQ